jgi:hypothetical protein
VVVAMLLLGGGGAVFALRVLNTGQTTTNPTAAPITQISPTRPAAPTAGITPTPVLPPTATPVLLTPDTASALIQEYYADINARNFDAAYDLYSTSYQQAHSRQSFVTGFQTFVQDTLTIQGAQTLADGTVEVDITLMAIDNKNGTQVTTNYAGYYIVIIENGALRILRAKVNKQ